MPVSRTRCLRWNYTFIILLLVAASTVQCGAVQKQALAREQEQALVPSQRASRNLLAAGASEEEPLLLVSTLDGKVAAVDRGTGGILWSFDTESALISSRSSDLYAFAVVPGVQGELYTKERGVEAGFQMLPHTLPEWVERTPSVMGDGSLWLGSRHTHAFFVDAKTGKLIKSYVEYGDGPVENSTDVADLPEDVQPILFGRVDYTVRALDQDTGEELFNVSYSHLMRLDSEQHLPTHGELPRVEGSHATGKLGISLDSQQRNTLQRVDPKTGDLLWSTQFDQPPVVVFAGGEFGISLYEEPAWPAQKGIASGLYMGKREPPSIVVDRLGSSYYALPLSSDNRQEKQQSHFKALLPAAAGDLTGYAPHVAEECTLDAQEDAVAGVADTSSQEHDGSSWKSPVGVHLLDSTPSHFIPRRFSNANVTGEADVKGWLEGIGMIGMSLIAGGILMLVWLTTKYLEEPHMIASLKEDDDDIKTLTLSYTGTTQEAEEARRNGQAFLRNHAEAGGSSIRDYTGSGVCNNPDDSRAKNTAGKGTVEESPFSAQSSQAQHRTSRSDSSFESPPPGSKKRKKKTKRSQRGPAQPAQGSSTQVEVQGESGIAEESESSSGESDAEINEDSQPHRQRGTGSTHEQPASSHGRDVEDRRGEIKSDQIQPSSSAVEEVPPFRSSQGTSTSTSTSSAFKRSEWRDGITYVGRLAIGPAIVGYGSSGTLVFEGSLDGRHVAVKRVLRQFYELARKEIGALIVADEHPNIVRCFAMEEDTEFVYLALERCKQSLNDLLGGPNPEGMSAFLQTDGQPTSFCLKVCEEVGKGLMALHERGIVHRDLKPHNVLLTEGGRTKLSDMGLCKRLTTDQTSYDSAGPGGSSGWQAPEQLILRSGGEARQGRSVDVFAFGLLLFYCLTGGQHAFGEGYERDYRILNGRANLDALASLPEAMNLIRAMLRPQPKQRPSMAAIMAHPFWWAASRKLAFLIDVSNRVENEDREVDRSLLQSLESCTEEAIGGSNWAEKLDGGLLANLGRYRKYNTGSLRDLLRVIRNKHNHFREMPEELQEKLGPLPDAYLRYFTERFPGLLLTTYSFALSHCSEEPLLEQYFPPAARDFPFASAAVAIRFAQTQGHSPGPPLLRGDRDRTSSAPAAVRREPALATVEELRESTQRSKSDGNLLPPVYRETRMQPQAAGSTRHRGWWSSSESERANSNAASLSDRSNSSNSSAPSSSSQLWQFLEPSINAGPGQQPGRNASPGPRRHASPGGRNLPPPSGQRPPLPPTGTPPVNPILAPPLPPAPRLSAALSKLPGPDADGMLAVGDALKVRVPPPGVKQLRDLEGYVVVFPQRPDGATVCDFFAKTGNCKFGEACKFHHPLAAAVKLTLNGGYPLRPGQPVCPFYDRTGDCKYSASCKFHHPHVPTCRSSDSASASLRHSITTSGSTSAKPSSSSALSSSSQDR